MKGDGLLKCSEYCLEKGVACPVTECRLWIDFEEEQNCCDLLLISSSEESD